MIEMGAPRRDEEGKFIEDEFSHLPTAMQYLRRTWKELTFYEKVPSYTVADILKKTKIFYYSTNLI